MSSCLLAKRAKIGERSSEELTKLAARRPWPFPPYLREFSDVVQLVDLGAERVEDCHVVGVLQQLLLQVLEHSQRVAEQNLSEGEAGNLLCKWV